MCYKVLFVKDGDLPDGHAWALARDVDGSCYVFIKQGCVTPRVLEEAWAGFRRIVAKFRLVA